MARSALRSDERGLASPGGADHPVPVTNKLRLCLVAAAAAALAGCASRGEVPLPRPQEQASQPVLSLPGPAASRTLDLMGRTAGQLAALFGQPALDVREGTARKLQFLNGRCVLDAYLYPGRNNRAEPVVTHVDTRLPDGRDTDRAGCAEALRRR